MTIQTGRRSGAGYLVRAKTIRDFEPHGQPGILYRDLNANSEGQRGRNAFHFVALILGRIPCAEELKAADLITAMAEIGWVPVEGHPILQRRAQREAELVTGSEVAVQVGPS
jgi:hypothetical protein